MRSRTAGLRNLSLRSTYSGRFRPTRVLRMANSACLKCHGEIAAKTVTGKTVRVSHKEFAEDIICAECHSGTGHRRQAKPGATATTAKQYCMRCHNGAAARGDCGICHIAFNGKTRRAEGTLTTVDIKLECDGCHSEESCFRCHKPRPRGGERVDY